jgi:hypothetical protein
MADNEGVIKPPVIVSPETRTYFVLSVWPPSKKFSADTFPVTFPPDSGRYNPEKEGKSETEAVVTIPELPFKMPFKAPRVVVPETFRFPGPDKFPPDNGR